MGLFLPDPLKPAVDGPAHLRPLRKRPAGVGSGGGGPRPRSRYLAALIRVHRHSSAFIGVHPRLPISRPVPQESKPAKGLAAPPQPQQAGTREPRGRQTEVPRNDHPPSGIHFRRPILAPTSRANFRHPLLAPTSDANFRRPLLAPTSDANFRRQLPASTSGAHFRRQLPASTVGADPRVHPCRDAPAGFSRAIAGPGRKPVVDRAGHPGYCQGGPMKPECRRP